MKTIMIRVKGNPISEAYANYCKPSWKGFGLRTFDAVTPETLGNYNDLSFSEGINEVEKACFYSQYLLWKKCAVENVPILILEHDAYLEKPEAIIYNPFLDVQYFGQHSMEAVLYSPRFCKLLISKCRKQKVRGPMSLVDDTLGLTSFYRQSERCLPHARYIGPRAPVKSVLDVNAGTTIDHSRGKGSTASNLDEKRLATFKLIDLKL